MRNEAQTSLHGWQNNVMTIDTIITGLFLMVTIPASEKQNSVCSVFFWVKHIVTGKGHWRKKLLELKKKQAQVPFRTEANSATHPSWLTGAQVSKRSVFWTESLTKWYESLCKFWSLILKYYFRTRNMLCTRKFQRKIANRKKQRKRGMRCLIQVHWSQALIFNPILLVKMKTTCHQLFHQDQSFPCKFFVV